jgi:DHA2 family multidrug resistance protein-like MFS transporter
MAGGMVLAAVGFAVLTQVGGPSGLAALVTGYVLFSLGLAPVFTLATDLIVGAAPPERAGAASAIAETSSELGGALGIAILGSIVTAIYRSAMVSTIPAGVPHQAANAARDTLGGALAVTEQLPDETGAALLGTAREAFGQAFETTVIICAAVALAAAMLAAILLRDVGNEPHSEPDGGDDGSNAQRAVVGEL